MIKFYYMYVNERDSIMVIIGGDHSTKSSSYSYMRVFVLNLAI